MRPGRSDSALWPCGTRPGATLSFRASAEARSRTGCSRRKAGCTGPALTRHRYAAGGRKTPLRASGLRRGRSPRSPSSTWTSRASANGIESLIAFLAGAPITELTGYPVAQTPSGGYHIWLRTPPWAAVPERPGILPGVDAKGDGGYVLAAPSARLVVPMGLDGERVEPVPVPYAWTSGCPCSVPPAPGWMGGWLATAPVNQQQASGADAPPDVEEMMRTGVPVGERNHTVYRAACSLYRRYGTGPEVSGTVIELIRRIWEASDRTDFGWREVLVCTESARKFIRGQQQQERMALASWIAGHGQA